MTRHERAMTINTARIGVDTDVLLARTEDALSIGLVHGEGTAIIVYLKQLTDKKNITPENLHEIATVLVYGSVIMNTDEFLIAIGDAVADTALYTQAIADATGLIPLIQEQDEQRRKGDSVSVRLTGQVATDTREAENWVDDPEVTAASLVEAMSQIESEGQRVPIETVLALARSLAK